MLFSSMDGAEQLPSTALALPPAPCWATGHFAPLILSARTTAAARSTARVTESTSAPQVVPSALEVQVSHQEEHRCTRGLEAALTTMM